MISVFQVIDNNLIKIEFVVSRIDIIRYNLAEIYGGRFEQNSQHAKPWYPKDKIIKIYRLSDQGNFEKAGI